MRMVWRHKDTISDILIHDKKLSFAKYYTKNKNDHTKIYELIIKNMDAYDEIIDSL